MLNDNQSLGTIKTHEKWMDSRRLILLSLFMCEFHIVICGLIALFDTSIACKFVLLSA